MNLAVALDARFLHTPDGAVWTDAPFHRGFWLRYLPVFAEVKVIARSKAVSEVPAGFARVDGSKVQVCKVPYFHGPTEYVEHVRAVRRAVQKAIDPEDAVLLRVGSQVANCAMPVLWRTGHPYALEVVGDPYDVFAPGALHHIFRPLFRWWFPKQLRQQCARACACSYVSLRVLPARYPTPPGAFVTHYSSINLHEGDFAPAARSVRKRVGTWNLITIASLEQPYKGVDVLVNAVRICLESGVDLRLSIIGNGRCSDSLKTLARSCGVSGRVRWLGAVPPGDAVRARLDEADLFVLASRTEGLPRAMVEAMARALPCVGTSVGGIPDLLPGEDTVASNDPGALAAKIRDVLDAPGRLEKMAARNLLMAQNYCETVLAGRRYELLQFLKSQTEGWQAAKSR